MMEAIAVRLSPSRGSRTNIPAAWASARRSIGRACLRSSQAASVSTGQQVRSGAGSLAKVSTQRRWRLSDSARRATSGPVSSRMRRSVTPEAFHMLGIGAQVVRSILVDAEDTDAPSDVETGFAGGTLPHVLLQRLAHDIGRADAFLPGFGFEFLLEPFIDTDVNAFHRHSPIINLVSDSIPR